VDRLFTRELVECLQRERGTGRRLVESLFVRKGSKGLRRRGLHHDPASFLSVSVYLDLDVIQYSLDRHVCVVYRMLLQIILCIATAAW
jgi:hypothetical protein